MENSPTRGAAGSEQCAHVQSHLSARGLKQTISKNVCPLHSGKPSYLCNLSDTPVRPGHGLTSRNGASVLQGGRRGFPGTRMEVPEGKGP